MKNTVRRLVFPSTYLPLAGDGFIPAFEVRWEEHVDFGTSRSHKKKAGQQMEWRAKLETRKQEDEAKRPVADADEAEVPPPKQRRVANADSSQGKSEKPKAPPTKTKPATGVLTNKGRFAGTLAASLLAGGGGGVS